MGSWANERPGEWGAADTAELTGQSTEHMLISLACMHSTCCMHMVSFTGVSPGLKRTAGRGAGR